MTQGIRPSQFVTTYGPGAILETKNGPVIIPTPDTGLFHRHSRLSPNDYSVDTVVASTIREITGKGNSGSGVGIFRVPTNAELNCRSDQAVYRTIPFPRWRLCLQQGEHKRRLAKSLGSKMDLRALDRTDILHVGDSCPVCTYKSSGKNAIRFVSVCNEGHLDDVNWDALVHGGSCPKSLDQKYFLWIRTGGMLKDIKIACPFCNKWINFGRCFYNEQACSGRRPESEPISSGPHRNPSSCGVKKSRIMQRQAANIRIPVVQTYLAIHPTRTRLDNLARSTGIGMAGVALSQYPGGLADDANFDKFVSAMEDTRVSANTVAEFKRAERKDVIRAINDIKADLPKTYTEILDREYSVLIRASKDGAPPKSSASTSPPSFEVCKQDVITATTTRGNMFTVVPIQTLEAVTVQLGFRRIVPSVGAAVDRTPTDDEPSKVVYVDFPGDDDKRWYPGTLLRGEGLFITLEGDGRGPISGPASDSWMTGTKNIDYPEHLFRDPDTSRDELDPGFVWWHTLSHLLIRSLGELAGYSAASIRERVYYKSVKGMQSGGILLYATQPGTEGTLGGLVGLAPRIGSFIARAKWQSGTCSADPVCEQDRFAPRKVTGSCCYGCLLNPETSCEHRNMWLDRAVVGENPP